MLAIVLMSSMYAPAFASNVTVTLEGQQVHAKFTLSLVQNVTSLPNVTATLDSSTDSNVSAAFTQALTAADPSASPANLSIGVISTKRDLNLTYSMDVIGVSQRNGDILSVNMTWLQFDVNADLRTQNLSFNKVGDNYFRSIVAYYANASRFVARPNATITGVTFFTNGTSIGPPAAEDYVGNFTTLNFDSLNPDLDQWNRTYTLNNNTTTWRYFPSRLLDFDMQIQRKNVTTDYTASYGYNATMSVQGVGRAKGRILLADVGTGEAEWVMAAIVILAVISAIGVQLLYRNRKKKLVKFQRK